MAANKRMADVARLELCASRAPDEARPYEHYRCPTQLGEYWHIASGDFGVAPKVYPDAPVVVDPKEATDFPSEDAEDKPAEIEKAVSVSGKSDASVTEVQGGIQIDHLDDTTAASAFRADHLEKLGVALQGGKPSVFVIEAEHAAARILKSIAPNPDRNLMRASVKFKADRRLDGRFGDRRRGGPNRNNPISGANFATGYYRDRI